MAEARGRCNCGGVAFRARNLRETVTFCHCDECRRFCGHHWAATVAPVEDVTFSADATLTWYAHRTDDARGFCGRCGASLFYRPADGSYLGIAPGTLDAPTGLRLGRHIWACEKGDYYALAEGVPVFDRYPG